MVNETPIGAPHVTIVQNADEAYACTLSLVLARGQELTFSEAALSTGAGLTTKELMNTSLFVQDPVQRLVFNAKRKINLPAAVARFVWMMAGSDRLADIAFYEPKVRFFSDDGVSVPGSNYGERMLQPRPGLNQLAAVIERLRRNPASRRAAIAIYHPEDAVRDSKDVPCTFGIFYHVRAGSLHATTMMRSNNAFILLPYNLFEFSLLAETVARELKVEFSSLTHQAVSMHVYERDFAEAVAVAEAGALLGSQAQVAVPLMPEDPSPLSQIRELVILEAQLRHESAGVSHGNIEEWIRRGSDNLAEYWNQYFLLLLTHVAHANQEGDALIAIESYMEEPWRSYLPEDMFDASVPRSMTVENLLEFGTRRTDSDRFIPIGSSGLSRSLEQRAKEWEADNDANSLSWRDYSALQRHFGSKIAARDSADISEEEFTEALKMLRTTRAEPIK